MNSPAPASTAPAPDPAAGAATPAQSGGRADFAPASGTLEEWNEALSRVEDYLRANRVHSRIHQTLLSRQILERAAAGHAANPSLNPTTLAAEAARELIERRMARLVEDVRLNTERAELAGRVAFMLAAGPARSPDFLLDDKPVPPELLADIRRHSVRTGPDLAVSPMAPRPIDLGLIPDMAEFTFELFERRPWLRMLLLWAVFLLLMLGFFFLLRGRF